MKKFLFFASLVVFIIVGFHGCKSAEETGGNIHLQEGRYDRAIEQYMKAVEKYPKSPGPVVSIAAANYMKKKFVEAAKYLDKGFKLNEKEAEGKLLSVEKLLNTKYLKWQIYYNGAVKYFDKDVNKAIEYAQKSLDVEDPKKVSLSYVLLAKIMSKEGKTEEAMSYFVKAKEADKDNVETYIYLGHYYLTEKKLDEALENFDEALKIDSKRIEVYELIGQTYLLKKDYDNAVKSLEKAMSIVGKNATILYNLVVANYQSKNYDEAIKRGKEVLALTDVKPSVLTNTYNLMGQLFETKKEYSNAIAVMKESIDKGVNDCNAFSIIAHSYYKLGKVKESSSWSKKWDACTKNK